MNGRLDLEYAIQDPLGQFELWIGRLRLVFANRQGRKFPDVPGLLFRRVFGAEGVCEARISTVAEAAKVAVEPIVPFDVHGGNCNIVGLPVYDCDGL